MSQFFGMEQSDVKLLIVEDEETILRPLSEKLQAYGYEVLEAYNGAEGLEIGLKEKPDMILLDLLMPKMDGVTMLEKIREDSDWGVKVPVVVLSNLGPESSKTHNLAQLYPVAHLVKADWPIEDILMILKRSLEEKNQM